MEQASSVQFAQKAAIIDGTRLLMIRKSQDDPHNPGLWELPGGRIQFGENTEEHLVREVQEEVGLEVIPGRPIHVWSWIMHKEDGSPVQVIAIVRLCTLTGGELTCDNQSESDYISRACWYHINELDGLHVIESQRQAINLVAKEAGSALVNAV